jgi:hypothetical protein
VLLCEQDAGISDAPQWLLTAIKDLDAILDGLSGSRNEGFWSDESLVADARWQSLRVSSRELLKQLGVPRAHPTLDGIFAPADIGE